MRKYTFNQVFIFLSLFGFSSSVFASSMNPAYIFLGSGIFVVLALAVYVVKQTIRTIRHDCDQHSVK